ncbi:membrane protein [Salmonella enterica subsp. enterica]|uniref:Membrane protein n=1 Tax=Salmonella enterica I TaxID=59201 RepID=A0A3S4I7Q6_SALET|nr:membrane protein [Salmonella enterica subsp. enterica]
MPGWRKIFEGKRFLYELPWFMVVGSPGDGKTTALLNTGLQFPAGGANGADLAYPDSTGWRHATLRLVVYQRSGVD